MSIINKISMTLIITTLIMISSKVIAQTSWELTAEDYTKKNNFGGLREFHEGAIFIMKRYATLEALVIALEQNKPENEALGTGAASILPGVGQMINEDYLQGGLLLFATGMSWSTVQQLSFTKKKRKQYLHLLPLYYGSIILKNGIMTYSMLHAGNAQYRMDRDKTAAIWTGMSSIVPGVGQVINGDWWAGGGMFLAWSLAAVISGRLEENIFVNGDKQYLVEKQNNPAWSVAIVPGGLMMSLSQSW